MVSVISGGGGAFVALDGDRVMVMCRQQAGALSVALLIARIFSDRLAARQALTLRPITITRLHY